MSWVRNTKNEKVMRKLNRQKFTAGPESFFFSIAGSDLDLAILTNFVNNNESIAQYLAFCKVVA